MNCDFLIVGGGIVGLATAYQIQVRFANAKIIVLEKERALATHQTGRNSGVLHSGIYYKPGSLKATTCRAGRIAMEDFCRTQNVPIDICGKLIVATHQSELATLNMLYQRGRDNQIECKMVDQHELHSLEPHVNGIKAIHVCSTGIVDYVKVCEVLRQIIEARNNEVFLQTELESTAELATHIEVRTSSSLTIEAGCLINCAGLQSDRVMKRCGYEPPVRIVPFRGEYYLLRDSARKLCRNLIYPVPDPNFPFLGVHFTRMIDGSVECGPNAVLALGREAYRWRESSFRESASIFGFSGFRSLAKKYWRQGAKEMWRSISKSAFVASLQRLVPEINAEDLIHAPAGIRAQAIDASGRLLDDFLIEERPRMFHVLNAPSPAATASLEIAQHIVDRVESGSRT